MTHRVVLVLLLCATSLFSYSQPDQLWNEASRHYQEGAYRLSATAYEKWLAQGKSAFAAHYNLGNCYYQLNQTALAILSYEKALRFRPHHRAAKINLQLARERMTDQITPVRGFFLNRWIHHLSFSLSITAWTVLFLVLLWTGVAVIILKWLKIRTFRRSRSITTLTLTIGVLALLMGVERYLHFHDNSEAIVMEAQSLKVAPDPVSADVRPIPEGAKVYVLDSLENFLKVRLQNYEEGWVPREEIRKIKM